MHTHTHTHTLHMHTHICSLTCGRISDKSIPIPTHMHTHYTCTHRLTCGRISDKSIPIPTHMHTYAHLLVVGFLINPFSFTHTHTHICSLTCGKISDKSIPIPTHTHTLHMHTHICSLTCGRISEKSILIGINSQMGEMCMPNVPEQRFFRLMAIKSESGITCYLTLHTGKARLCPLLPPLMRCISSSLCIFHFPPHPNIICALDLWTL